MTKDFKRDVYLGEPSNLLRILNELECDEVAISAISTSDQVLKILSNQAGMPLAIGGEVDSAERAVELSRLGFEKISVSSAFFINPEIIAEISSHLGRASTMLTLAVKKVEGKYYLWNWKTRQILPLKLSELLSAETLKDVGELFVRDVSRNGSLAGPDLDLAKLVKEEFGGNLVFEGGIRSTEDVQDLWEIGVDSVLSCSAVSLYGRYRASLIDYEKPLQNSER